MPWFTGYCLRGPRHGQHVAQEGDVFNASLPLPVSVFDYAASLPSVVEYGQYKYCSCNQWVWQGRYLVSDAKRHMDYARERAEIVLRTSAAIELFLRTTRIFVRVIEREREHAKSLNGRSSPVSECT